LSVFEQISLWQVYTRPTSASDFFLGPCTHYDALNLQDEQAFYGLDFWLSGDMINFGPYSSSFFHEKYARFANNNPPNRVKS
jgi:hypothetical protein